MTKKANQYSVICLMIVVVILSGYLIFSDGRIAYYQELTNSNQSCITKLEKDLDAADIVIDCLTEDIRGYKALNEAQEGRIRKMAGAYHIRELELLKEIDRLKKKLLDCDTPPNQEPIEPAPLIPGCR